MAQFGNLGSAAGDLFGAAGDLFSGDMKAKALNLKAQGDLAEASNYDLAAGLAEQNKQYTVESTAIQQAQQQRSTYMQIGGQQADIAGAGFAQSGSALDILRESASQGALAKEVLGRQGLITEAGYEEQAKSYTTMAEAARATAAGEMQLADEAKTAGVWGGVGKLIGGALNIAAIFTGQPELAAAGGFVAELPNNPSNPLVINKYGTPGPDVPNNPLPGLY